MTRIFSGLAVVPRIVQGIVLAFTLAAAPAALAQEAGKTQQASLPPNAGKPEPMPRVGPGMAGQGPLTLTSSAAVTYQEYFAHACPLVLTVDAYGWTTHAALNTTGECPADVSKIPQETIRGALNACEAYTHNPPCAVVAVGRKVVWDGPIRYVPGQYISQDSHQAAVVLRRTVAAEMDPSTLETAVGLVTFGASGDSGELVFQRHKELGQCRGSLTKPANDDNATVMLTCTKTAALTGSVALKTADRTGSGALSNDHHHYELTILPKADFMMNGTLIYEPEPEPDTGTASGGKMMKSDEKGAS